MTMGESKKEPTKQEKLAQDIEEYMDLLMKVRAKSYIIDMELRACRKCLANGGKP